LNLLVFPARGWADDWAHLWDFYPGTVLYYKIERVEHFRPSCLTPVKLLRRHEVAQVGMVRRYSNWISAAFQEDSARN